MSRSEVSLEAAESDDVLLRASELAKVLRLSVDTINAYVVRYGMPYVALPSGQRRFLLGEVRRWLRSLQPTSK